MTPHPALPGLLLATASESWPEWCAVSRLALADLCEELGRPAPWLRRGLHPKALARALVRERRGRRRRSYLGLRHAFRLVRLYLAGRARGTPARPAGDDATSDVAAEVAACVERGRRRFRRRALCLFPGVRVPCPECKGGGGGAQVYCRQCDGTARVPAPDLLPREPGRRRRGHAALDRAISEAVLPPGPGAPRARRAYPARQAFEMIREARRRRGTP
jgi:hypothetical protein